MDRRFHLDEPAAPSAVSTGALPDGETVRSVVQEAHRRFAAVEEGTVADYIPALAITPRHLFGICVVGVNGAVHAAGDADHEFSIQSIAKPFVFALVCQALGGAEARLKIGVNSTGLPFNSVMAIELNRDRTMNPMVNAGAIATTSLAPGDTAEAKWRFNPVTRALVIDPDRCMRVLSVLATAGLYEQSGDWLYGTGLPGKSGVSGGIVTIAAGKGGLGTFAPALDAAGNSVKGQLVTKYLSARLGLNLFASRPHV